MIDQPAIASWPNTSTVSTKPEDRTCPAPDQNNECRDCRKCWNPEIKNICYGKHWWNLDTQSIIKNYASVINRIRSLAKNRRRLGISVHLVRASSIKLQAPSSKLQASSAKLLKHQATSLKPQAASIKLKATSFKLQDSRTTEKFYGARAKGLDHDKCIVWMFNMKGYLMWRKPYFIPLAYL